MTAYYNENNDDAAAWLRVLIAEGHIAPGDVDTRSIVDVRPSDLDGFSQCHFFAGIGGWSLALRLVGWPDDRPVWTGSCPCQPFSVAGRRKGFSDDRHLWPEFRRLISERRPARLFGEQVASAADWLRLVRGDLEALDYAVGAIPIEAASAGADHLRDRYWFVADAAGERLPWPATRGGDAGLTGAECNGTSDGVALGDAGRTGLPLRSIAEVERGDLRQEGPTATAAGDRSAACDLGHTNGERRFSRKQAATPTGHGHSSDAADRFDWVIGADGKARRVKSGVRLLVDGFPSRVGLLRGFGNAIDPRPAAKLIEATM